MAPVLAFRVRKSGSEPHPAGRAPGHVVEDDPLGLGHGFIERPRSVYDVPARQVSHQLQVDSKASRVVALAAAGRGPAPSGAMIAEVPRWARVAGHRAARTLAARASRLKES